MLDSESQAKQLSYGLKTLAFATEQVGSVQKALQVCMSSDAGRAAKCLRGVSHPTCRAPSRSFSLRSQCNSWSLSPLSWASLPAAALASSSSSLALSAGVCA